MPEEPERPKVSTPIRAFRVVEAVEARAGRKATPPTERTPEVDAGKELTAARRAGGVFTRSLVRRAAADALRKLNPRAVARNPVMFVVEVGAAITTLVMLHQIVTRTGQSRVHVSDYVMALVHGRVRQFRRGDG